jgi:hypothetical protein
MNPESHTIKLAREFWDGGQPLKAGQLIFEELPIGKRPAWAASILRLVIEKSGIDSAPVENVLRIASSPAEWHTAHRAFTVIRALTLECDIKRRNNELAPGEQMMGWVLALAELVAKVTYNATRPPDEFDEDSGWWLAACLRGFVDNIWDDATFANSAWTALKSHRE